MLFCFCFHFHGNKAPSFGQRPVNQTNQQLNVIPSLISDSVANNLCETNKLQDIQNMSFCLICQWDKLPISLTQPTFLPLTIQSLSETFIRRSMINSSSGSCHDSDATWQEIGHTCGSECSCPRPGSRIVVPPFEYVLLL